MSGPPRLFDRDLHRRRLQRAARGYAAAAFLKRRAAEDIVQRLEIVKRDFPLAVDLGSRDGAFAAALAASDAAAKIGVLFETDLSEAMLAGRPGPRLVADEEQLPFAPESLDLVVSSLALHWTNDFVGALIQIREALKPDGLLGGSGPRVSPFADAYDAAGLLQRAGFALPVADVDRVTVRYDHIFTLMADLRAMGETSTLVEGARRPLSRKVLARAAELYADKFAAPDGRVVATFEILTLTGWAPHAGQPQPLRPGSAKMRLADALQVQERNAGEKAGR